MHVRCPHCRNPMEVIGDKDLSADVECPTCGSNFSLLVDETTPLQKRQARTIAHFDLLEQVGVGSFGSVWKAHDTQLDRAVAVKIPRKGQLDSEEADQFLREARSAAQLKHPRIVAVHEIGREEGQIYIVSDFIEGLPLSSWLTARQLTFREAAELSAKIAEALHHAHEAGVIHRDLKPSNIMLDSAGEPHIMDFGLAKREAGEITMTIDGKVLGTPAYMSPEQARGEAHAADRRTDIYSLGVILFELLTGEKPFRGDYRMLLHQVLHDEAPAPRQLKLNLPRDLDTICLKCLEKQPDKRYASAREVAEELERFIQGKPILARPLSPATRGWRWCQRNRVAACLAVVGPVVAAVMFLLFVQARHERGKAERALNESLRAKRAADRARDEADAARASAMQARDKASATVDRYFTRIATDNLLNAPGMQELRRELLEEAKNHYEEYADEDSDDSRLQASKAMAYFNLGRIAEGNDRFDEAIWHFRQAAEIQSRDPSLINQFGDSLNGLGIAYDRQRRFAEALDAYRRAAIQRQKLVDASRPEPPLESGEHDDADPSWIVEDPRLKLANTYMNIGLTLREMRPAELVDLGDELREFLENDSTGELRSPLDFFEDANAARARRKAVLQSLIAQDPGNSDLRTRLGNISRDLGKGYFSHALFAAKDPARVASTEQRYRDAIANFERALEISPNDLDVQFVTSLCHRAFGEFRYRTDHAVAREQFLLARGRLERLVFFNPEIPRYRKEMERLGLAFRNLGIVQYQGNRADLDSPLENFRAAGEVLAQLEAQFPNQHRFRLEETRDLIKRFQSYKLRKLRELLSAEEYAAGLKLADELAAEHWEDGRTLNQIAWMLVTEVAENQRDLDQALRIAERANELQDFANDATLDTVARVYYEQGDLDRAIEWQRKALEHATTKNHEELSEHLRWYEKERDNGGQEDDASEGLAEPKNEEAEPAQGAGTSATRETSVAE